MQLYLYSTAYPEPLPVEKFHRLLGLLPTVLQERIGKYRRWQDAHGALLGKILLRMALEKADHDPDLGHLHYSERKKPFLPDGPDFNISHSGHRVVCILSTGASVGIDIERIKPLAFDGFEDQFTPQEWTAIQGAASPLAAFFHNWTAKESLIKADGRGLDIPLQELDLSGNTGSIPLDGRHWSVHHLPFFDGYACHMAVEYQTPNAPPPAIELFDLRTADL